MAKVFIPPALRELTGQQEIHEAVGHTVRAVLVDLETRFPGLMARLCDGDVLRPGLMVAVGGRMSKLGLRTPVPEGAEVHFLPALGGG